MMISTLPTLIPIHTNNAMLFIVDPYAAEPEYLGPEDAYIEFKRRQYIAALEERQRRVQFERELEREEQRHKLMLASIARQEAERRRREQHYKIQRQRELQQLHQLATHEQLAQRQQQQREPEQQRPSQEEILNRRRKRQEEEETRSRDFHKHILSQIFGVPFDDEANGTERAEPTLARTESSTTESTGANMKVDAAPAMPADSFQTTESTEPSQTTPTTEDASEPPVDAHWSNAPERARALAEITSLGRIFSTLKNTFVFPEGRLERLAGHDTPRLAYNSTNTAIHAYEHALSELLTKLDSIESHGFKGVREARKQLVISIEQELGALEKKIAERLASVDAASTPQDISIPVEDAPNRSEEPSKPQDAPTQDVVEDEAPRDTAAEHDISLAVAEEVQNITLEQRLTNSEMAGETAKNVDDAVETREDEPLSDTRPIPEASVTDENPGVALDRNRDGEVAVTEHVPPTMPAGDVPHDEDSEVEDAVEVMLEPQRTAVPAGDEYEYELV